MYSYSISGGCGSSKLDIMLNDQTFNITYFSKWMGDKLPNTITMTGQITINDKNYKQLIVNKINDKKYYESKPSPIIVKIYDLHQDIDFYGLANDAMDIDMGYTINGNNKYNSIVYFEYNPFMNVDVDMRHTYYTNKIQS